MGASGAFLFALARRRLNWRSLLEVLVESARTTAMLFTLLIAATIFANFINFTSLPRDLTGWITGMGLSPIMVVCAMMATYVLLGTVMEELTMVLLTIPLFFPIVLQLGFDPVWFGVLIAACRYEPVCGQCPVAQGWPACHFQRRVATGGSDDRGAGSADRVSSNQPVVTVQDDVTHEVRVASIGLPL
jgi:hypothetical protein